MPRILRNLRIDEISSVDKGAGDGVRIVLMKRHAGASQRLRRMFGSIDYSNFRKMEPSPVADDIDDVDDDFSDDAAFISGQVLVVDGGWLATRYREGPPTG